VIIIILQENSKLLPLRQMQNRTGGLIFVCSKSFE